MRGLMESVRVHPAETDASTSPWCVTSNENGDHFLHGGTEDGSAGLPLTSLSIQNNVLVFLASVLDQHSCAHIGVLLSQNQSAVVGMWKSECDDGRSRWGRVSRSEPIRESKRKFVTLQHAQVSHRICRRDLQPQRINSAVCGILILTEVSDLRCDHHKVAIVATDNMIRRCYFVRANRECSAKELHATRPISANRVYGLTKVDHQIPLPRVRVGMRLLNAAVRVVLEPAQTVQVMTSMSGCHDLPRRVDPVRGVLEQ
ncbi:hypothetical protein Kfla_2077 [Kribbella flavida DSM 17836]|uniref:Uncharacterized protein n=1 Tax=Kribbella flavida (strain DSM 17836 / JCM 10339 / NBRC 14399) TaxID=479435 RepID=D2PS35_KRIFD|nr:hypothetical protein Kfla_2077 [Kribbella flavida DSM 17836]